MQVKKMAAIMMYSETCIKQTSCYGGWQQFPALPSVYALMKQYWYQANAEDTM